MWVRLSVCVSTKQTSMIKIDEFAKHTHIHTKARETFKETERQSQADDFALEAQHLKRVRIYEEIKKLDDYFLKEVNEEHSRAHAEDVALHKAMLEAERKEELALRAKDAIEWKAYKEAQVHVRACARAHTHINGLRIPLT